MPNFQGAVNEVLNQAGLYSSLSGRTQDLREMRRLGKEEKIAGKQLLNVGRDVSETASMVKEARASGDYSALPELMKKANLQGEELSRLAKSTTDIRERRYQLKPTQRNYDSLMTARIRENSIEERQKLSMERMNEQVEAKRSQKDNIRKHIEGLPISLGGKVKDLDPALREQVIKKYMEANNGEQE